MPRVRARFPLRVVKKSLAPEWNETFEFPFSRRIRFVRVDLFDHDLVGKHDFLGRCLIPVAHVTDTPWQEWYPVGKRSHKSHVKGRVFLEFSTSLPRCVAIRCPSHRGRAGSQCLRCALGTGTSMCGRSSVLCGSCLHTHGRSSQLPAVALVPPAAVGPGHPRMAPRLDTALPIRPPCVAPLRYCKTCRQSRQRSEC